MMGDFIVYLKLVTGATLETGKRNQNKEVGYWWMRDENNYYYLGYKMLC